MRRALIVGPGGLFGAYGGGVVATLGHKLGCDYFHSVYGCSAGAYTASYIVTGQPDRIESIWRNCVHSKLLIRWDNTFRKTFPVLDLFYLNDVLKSSEYQMDVEKLLSSKIKNTIVATDRQSGSPHYFSPTTSEEFFLQVRASAAVPFFHPKVCIEEREYVDGGMSDPFPVEKAIEDGHDDILIVCNQPRINFTNLDFVIFSMMTSRCQNRKQMIRSIWKMRNLEKKILESRVRIKVICPSNDSVIHWNFDSNQFRINQLVDLGVRDALNFLR